MSEIELILKLMRDIEEIGIKVENVDVFLRPFSVSYYGRYFPKNNKRNTARIYIYPYTRTGGLQSYRRILQTFIHEMCHHLQACDENYKRLKGVMHNSDFWNKFNFYMSKMEEVL